MTCTFRLLAGGKYERTGTNIIECPITEGNYRRKTNKQ
jgi:hypothetical protein